MAGHSFFGKQKLCYTEVSDFTDYQGIGHDPMYKRYDSVFKLLNVYGKKLKNPPTFVRYIFLCNFVIVMRQ